MKTNALSNQHSYVKRYQPTNQPENLPMNAIEIISSLLDSGLSDRQEIADVLHDMNTMTDAAVDPEKWKQVAIAKHIVTFAELELVDENPSDRFVSISLAKVTVRFPHTQTEFSYQAPEKYSTSMLLRDEPNGIHTLRTFLRNHDFFDNNTKYFQQLEATRAAAKIIGRALQVQDLYDQYVDYTTNQTTQHYQATNQPA